MAVLGWLGGGDHGHRHRHFRRRGPHPAPGRPPQRLTPLGSYEQWSGLVRATVVWLGLPDPAATRRELPTTAEAEDVSLAGFVAGLARLIADLGGTATARHMLLALEKPESRRRHAGLRETMEELFPSLGRGELPTAAQLGFRLRSLRGRVIGGVSIEGEKTRPGIVWKVRRRHDDAGSRV